MIRYLCRFCSVIGEVRDVLVELSPSEIRDVLNHHHGAGAPGGPLERRYAWDRAKRSVPAEFMPLYDQDRRITVH
jgi:hypothetical protein